MVSLTLEERRCSAGYLYAALAVEKSGAVRLCEWIIRTKSVDFSRLCLVIGFGGGRKIGFFVRKSNRSFGSPFIAVKTVKTSRTPCTTPMLSSCLITASLAVAIANKRALGAEGSTLPVRFSLRRPQSVRRVTHMCSRSLRCTDKESAFGEPFSKAFASTADYSV